MLLHIPTEAEIIMLFKKKLNILKKYVIEKILGYTVKKTASEIEIHKLQVKHLHLQVHGLTEQSSAEQITLFI